MKIINWVFLGVALCTIVSVGALLGKTTGGGYHLLQKYSSDDSARRLYLPHGTEVKVRNADAGEVVGTIRGSQPNHGIVLVKELNKGFVTDGHAAQVVVFDIKALKVTGQIKGN